MNDKEFAKLTKEDKVVLGEMFTEMLDVIVQELPIETVLNQKTLMFAFCNSYKKVNPTQVNACLVACNSKYRQAHCRLIYNNKPIINAYTRELTKRVCHKLVVKNRNTINELRDRMTNNYVIL